MKDAFNRLVREESEIEEQQRLARIADVGSAAIDSEGTERSEAAAPVVHDSAGEDYSCGLAGRVHPFIDEEALESHDAERLLPTSMI